MKNHEGHGILGTPLFSDSRSEFKVSAANKMAPTVAVYTELRSRTVTIDERKLMNEASAAAMGKDNLYTRPGPSGHLADIMDEEDKSHHRFKDVISRKATERNQSTSVDNERSLSFLAKTVELPEIVPTQAATSLGYRELCHLYSGEGQKSSHIKQETRSSSEYQAFLYFAHASQHVSRSGLGYSETIEEKAAKREIERTRISHLAGHRKTSSSVALKELNAHSGEEEDISCLANSGYKNLDLTENYVSRKLHENQTSFDRITGNKKRILGRMDSSNCERPRFKSFVEIGSLPQQTKKYNRFLIPRHYITDPKHACEKDQFRSTAKLLGPSLQQEYEEILRFQRENRKREEDVVRLRKAKATEEQEERLRKIRGLVLKDMGARFKPAQGHLGQPKGLHQDQHFQDRDKSHPTRLPRLGESNRTGQTWKPENLLCRRLGVESHESTRDLLLHVSNVPPRADPVEAYVNRFVKEESNTAVSRDSAITQHGLPVPHIDDKVLPVVTEERGKRPSQHLLGTIFTAQQQKDLTNSPKAAGEESKSNVLETKSEARDLHKTRAVDFF